ncbi:SGNH/GDSL hydrolase family protein [Nodularia harveyana UHCC-0300]|uniref:SGNH/GDSL hydrolase family protein n=1 Tax=Nodularia harveyana UHCC-0300 TaxID=2974287 RepID=A0ABU5U908_9CYAN|nr:SGNH/GDSL hydrolase family protein [Nodularia harveyana]MEA5579992.1 SGNH/GDSL hydrolase family protein [Nodularia harveyana UHCC-0300]
MSTSAKSFPLWGFFLLITNSILMLAVILLIWQQQRLTNVIDNPLSPNSSATPDLGPRHQLNYQQWVDILKQEAKVASEQPTERLSILVGDSLTLWFPPELLPEDRNWLNQGISGESSDGLLKRLDLFESTQPEVIFVMIGINDLIRGVGDQVILENQRQILTQLRKKHPEAEIVVQSILPHGGETATWEGKDKLLRIPNSQIRQLNQELANIAAKVDVKYLDLYPLFTNQQDNLRSELTTDGLHLNPTGYLVWRTALQMYSNLQLGE